MPDIKPKRTTSEVLAESPTPPIEIIAKRYLTGTTKHGCVGLAGSRVRASHPFYAGMSLSGDGALPEMLIRFDWRNPLTNPGQGERMAQQMLVDLPVPEEVRAAIVTYSDRCADAVLPLQLADLFIDVEQAQRTAFMTATALEAFLATRNIVFYDLCLFIDESGTLVYGEVSPDCGRYRHLNLGSLDKDVWRTGGSSADVIRKWQLLVDLLTGEVR